MSREVKAMTTARFYGFEKTLETLPSFAGLRQRRSIAQLQLAAGYVWAREAGRGKCPVIRPWEKSAHSECAFDIPPTIYLGRRHRNLVTLLHELAHALGTHDKLSHGPAFRNRCIRLYREYGGWNGEIDWDRKSPQPRKARR